MKFEMKKQIIDIICEEGWTDGELEAGDRIESFIFEFIKWYRPEEWKESEYEGIKDAYNYWFTHIYKEGIAPISMIPVASSQIKSVGYTSDTLYIEFNKGTVYSYDKVPETIFEALKAAESVGKYFGSEIKGKFDYAKTDRIVTNGELV